MGERGGSVVECRTPEREVRGSKPTAAVLCPWARHFTPRKYWLITQEAMALSWHDWKIVDWDVKPQHNQPNPQYIAPGQVQTTPWEQNFDVNRKALSFCPFSVSFKNISLKSDFINIFACFIHVYSPGEGPDNLLGSEFLCKHIPHVTLVICCKFLLLNDFLTVFPIYKYKGPNLTLL